MRAPNACVEEFVCRVPTAFEKGTSAPPPRQSRDITSAQQIKLITSDSSFTPKKDGPINNLVQEIAISTADETSMGVGNRNVKRDEQQVGPRAPRSTLGSLASTRSPWQ